MKNDSDPIYYVVILQPVELRALTKEVITKHAQHLRELDVNGINSIMKQDALVLGGFRTFEIRTWLMSNQTNNYLP